MLFYTMSFSCSNIFVSQIDYRSSLLISSPISEFDFFVASVSGDEDVETRHLVMGSVLATFAVNTGFQFEVQAGPINYGNSS